MRYIFSVCVKGEFSSFEVESNSLVNALKILGFDIFMTGCGSYLNLLLSPNYLCFTSRGCSSRSLSKKNLEFFLDYYKMICDSSVIMH